MLLCCMYHIMPKITYAGIIRQGLTYIHMSAAIYTHSPTPAYICPKGRHEPAQVLTIKSTECSTPTVQDSEERVARCSSQEIYHFCFYWRAAAKLTTAYNYSSEPSHLSSSATQCSYCLSPLPVTSTEKQYLKAKMQRPVTLEEVTSSIQAFKAQVESSSQCLSQRKVSNYAHM